MTFDGRFARISRLAVLIAYPPLLAFAYDRYCANTLYSIALAYVPVVFGGIGLVSRPVLDAAAGRTTPRDEFSGKGLLLGSFAAFFLLLIFAPQQIDRTALVALFLSSVAFYYAVGKAGCLALGCCRAVVPRRVPLPAIEALWSFALALVALATLYEPTTLRLSTFAAVIAAFLALRLFSRRARGTRMRSALAKPDSIALGALACVFIAIATLG